MNAWTEHLNDWTAQLERFLVARLGCPELARDLAQEAVTRLLHASGTAYAITDPRAWLFRAARNLAVDEVRKRLPSPMGMEALGAVVDPSSLPAAEPSWSTDGGEVTRGELLGMLPGAMARLPRHYRRMIEAHYRDGLDCEEVAEQEQITLQNAKVRLFRARRRLRDLLVCATRRRRHSEGHFSQ